MSIIFDSHVGKKRTNNEDSVAHIPLQQGDLLIVADGVGGRNYGEVASATVIEVMSSLAESRKFDALANTAMTKMMLTMAVQKAHVTIAKKAQDNPEYDGMSTTLTLVYTNDNRVWVAQVGDSRLYCFRDGALQQLTVDQTIARALMEAGRITEEQMHTHPDRNTLQQSMGLEAVGQPLDPVVSEHEWPTNSILLACSDGLTDMVNDTEIATILSGQDTLNGKLESLINAALDNGGKDNVTIVLAENDMSGE